MMPTANNSQEVLQRALKEKLYKKLLRQLDKDFKLANVRLDLPADMVPEKLKKSLHEKIYFLLMERFDDYLNLLYVVDISESEVKKITSSDTVDIAAEVCFLILKREWTKVWFKNKYSN
ncbi:hypothetical protein GTQ34_12485 [Muricauda sp. JGD-17]|uniref:Uncharacterized protein n=2 Tax=Flagellimonas ochracea TaxID=2696472 RepID=A0A964TD99_9FLAO|nr:hypothetical protein [Allomuricauda ochracea]